jgi:pilus assembly protein Flp/PilA
LAWRLPVDGIATNIAWERASTMMNIVKRFLADESGATAIEYGLIAAGISLAIIAVVNGLGTSLKTKFTSISSSLH